MLDTITSNGHGDKPNTTLRALLISSSRADAERIAFLLNRQGGFDISIISNEAEVLSAVATLEPQIVVLSMPEIDERTLSLCERIRESFNIAMVICSSAAHESDIVLGLESGADDYLVVPMHPVELAARLRAVVRRAKDSDFAQSEHDHLVAGDLDVDLDRRRVNCRGRAVDLSPTEFRLLTSLMRQAGRPVSHSKLLAQAWGPEYVDARNYIRLYIRRLRSKLEDDPDAPKMIVNERGIGYRFQPSAAA
jgi:DNA-binding response OmpR family regulator